MSVKDVTEQGVINLCGKDLGLQPEDIIVRKFKINMGLKDKNPIQFVQFYSIDELGNYFLVDNS